MLPIEDLLNRASVDNLSIELTLDAIAQLVDHASDQGDAGLTNRALNFCDTLEARKLSPVQQALLDYFRANAWANRQVMARRDRAAVWAWEQPELQKQVYYLRRALNIPAFDSLDVIRRCQILTNLANQLDTAGRFVEARGYWTQALHIDPNFWMARGNRGRSLIHYANALYDGGHRAVFGLLAHRDLVEAANTALQKPHLGDPAAARLYLQGAASIETIMEPSAVAATYNPDGHSLGKTKEERSYRNWCLRMTLFLNPLNDLESKSIAARDVLTLPNFVTALDELRNHIEHKYLKVHEMLLSRRPLSKTGDDPFYDTLAYALPRADLERKALRLLKLARAALIYLVLGMHREEKRRRKQRGQSIIGSMPLSLWDDDWKR